MMTKIAAVIAIFFTSVAHLWNKPPEPISPNQAAQIVFLAAAPLPIQTSTFALPVIASNSLPIVKLLPPKPKKITTLPVLKILAAPKKATTTVSIILPPKNITASAILANTTLSLHQNRDGSSEATLNTNLGNDTTLPWPINATTLGGTGGIPLFTVSSDCTPPAETPDPASYDQNPFFDVRTSYACSVSLTPTSGMDQRIQTKNFTFETGAGPLFISPAAAMDSVLVDDTNYGGFTFTNDDTQPATITSVTIDVSYTGLNTSTSPLVLRFLDGKTDTALDDYHIENLPPDNSLQYTESQRGITIPLSFTIPGNTARQLSIEALGVHKMYISGLNPTIRVTIDSVSIASDEASPIISAPTISWSCTIPVGAYDPNNPSAANDGVCKS